MKPTTADYVVMSDTLKRLSAMVPIDKHDLDTEIVMQADKYREVSDALASCLSYQAAAKDYFDQLQAELTRTVHADHEKEHAGKDKVPRLTDTAALAQVMDYKDWIDGKALRRDWDDLVQRMSGLQSAFSQRSSMLKELPALWLGGYFISNSAAGEPMQDRSRGEIEADRVRKVVTERRAAGRQPGAAEPSERRRPARG